MSRIELLFVFSPWALHIEKQAQRKNIIIVSDPYLRNNTQQLLLSWKWSLLILVATIKMLTPTHHYYPYTSWNKCSSKIMANYCWQRRQTEHRTEESLQTNNKGYDMSKIIIDKVLWMWIAYINILVLW